jgi:hypothetical protein
MQKYINFMKEIASAYKAEPREVRQILQTIPAVSAGYAFARDWKKETGSMAGPGTANNSVTKEANPLREYFNAHTTGKGIWKWDHYFDIYHRHCYKFAGKDVGVLEIGIYSGGSLDLWRTYFGAGCRIYGVDIEQACKSYEQEGIQVFIGDQADRSFWRCFRRQVPTVDIVIDDGGHDPEQQIVTLEEMLPHIAPGGVYICEDVHGIHHRFAAYVSGMMSHFNDMLTKPGDVLAAATNEFQKSVRSIHLYPFLVVIEMAEAPREQFVAPKHGTEWQPFSF